MNNTVAKDEVTLLDSDLREIYEDYGTDKIIVLKQCHLDNMVDDVYGHYKEGATYVPYQSLGMILIDNTDNLESTDLGRESKPYTYKVKVLKSSLTNQGVSTITTQDKLKYGEHELDIISVRPQPIVGNYCVQYSILARGEMIDLENIYG